MRNGNFLKMRVSEICVKRIRVNQGVGVHMQSVMKHIFKNLKKSKSNQHSRTWQTTTNILDQWEFCQSKMIYPHWILLYWYLCGSPSLFLSVVPTWLDTRYSDFFWSWWDRIENTNWHVCNSMHYVVVKSKIMYLNVSSVVEF